MNYIIAFGLAAIAGFVFGSGSAIVQNRGQLDTDGTLDARFIPCVATLIGTLTLWALFVQNMQQMGWFDGASRIGVVGIIVLVALVNLGVSLVSFVVGAGCISLQRSRRT